MYTNSIKIFGINSKRGLVRFISFAVAIQFVFLMTTVRAEDEDLVRDRDYLISLAKKIDDENNSGMCNLANMEAKIHKKDKYVVVDFSHKKIPGIVRKDGGCAYYFSKKDNGDYEFIKCLLGQ